MSSNRKSFRWVGFAEFILRIDFFQVDKSIIGWWVEPDTKETESTLLSLNSYNIAKKL